MRPINQIRAENKAFQLLDRFCLEDTRFDIEDVAGALGLRVEVGNLVHADAWLIRYSDGTGMIRVRQESPRRMRFSIAHEIGHWELHPECSQGFLVCTAADITDYGRSPEEAEANLFAASLLMPKHLISPQLLKRDPEFKVAESMALEFDVSRTAAVRRFVDLSKQPVVLVASDGNEVLWITRSASARRAFVSPGIPIPRHSVTAECMAESKSASGMELVDVGVWFPELDVGDDFEVFEQVRVAPAFNLVLTLLWLPGLG